MSRKRTESVLSGSQEEADEERRVRFKKRSAAERTPTPALIGSSTLGDEERRSQAGQEDNTVDQNEEDIDERSPEEFTRVSQTRCSSLER
jgi:hypothetical protein